jgi:hypothetical protein
MKTKFRKEILDKIMELELFTLQDFLELARQKTGDLSHDIWIVNSWKLFRDSENRTGVCAMTDQSEIFVEEYLKTLKLI